MKLKCRHCNKVLTDDLYPVNKHEYLTSSNKSSDKGYSKDVEILTPGGESCDPPYIVRDYIQPKFNKGIFVILPHEAYYNKIDYKEDMGSRRNYTRMIHTPKRILVSGKSVIQGVVPPFKSGHGCCGYSMGEELTCECGKIIAQMHLDCYEDGTVDFIDSEVIRVYK